MKNFDISFGNINVKESLLKENLNKATANSNRAFGNINVNQLNKTALTEVESANSISMAKKLEFFKDYTGVNAPIKGVENGDIYYFYNSEKYDSSSIKTIKEVGIRNAVKVLVVDAKNVIGD